MTTYPFPINPGADVNLLPPEFITWLPQEADVTLVGQKTNSYIIHGVQGAWVVDPPSSKDAAIDEIMQAARAPIVGIWITHAHPDHIAGVQKLVAQTRASVYAHSRAWQTLPTDVKRIDVNEGSEVDGWRVHFLPGHRFDHLAFIHGESGVALVGDLVAGAGSVIVDPSDGDLFDYLASLHRLRDELHPTMLLPGHGPLSAEPQQLLTHFINHRLKREQWVLAALTPTPTTLQALLPIAYADTPAHFYPLAERALLTHLQKLEKEGKAILEADGWRTAL